jgi:hypothetical protein
MKRAVLFIGLFLIVAANVLMMFYAPYGLIRSMEGYQNADTTEVAVAANNTAVATNNTVANNAAVANNTSNNAVVNNTGNTAVVNNSAVANNTVNRNATVNTPAEGFSSYNVDNAGAAKDGYQPIGQYDGVKLSTGNSISSWRYTAPNEPLTGAEFVPGDDELFMFKNNQCKPECCGASFSCGGGCVCTTPKQRQYIAERGGNRTTPEDSA